MRRRTPGLWPGSSASPSRRLKAASSRRYCATRTRTRRPAPEVAMTTKCEASSVARISIAEARQTMQTTATTANSSSEYRQLRPGSRTVANRQDLRPARHSQRAEGSCWLDGGGRGDGGAWVCDGGSDYGCRREAVWSRCRCGNELLVSERAYRLG